MHRDSCLQEDPSATRGAASRGARFLTIVLVLIWGWLALPLARGQETFYFRDVFTAHHHYKAFGAAELAQGRITATDPSWALGQSFRGNPGALAFYPGNVFYLLFPFWNAFNLHFVLHWLLAFLAMRGLARALGQSEGGALCAAVTYAGCGWMLSGLTLYNVLVVSAWWPLVLRGAVRDEPRARALAGIALGLALLGGAPVTAVIGAVPLALLALSRHGVRRGARVILEIAGVGLLIALPQIVATARVLSFSSRTALEAAAGGGLAFGFHPLRLVELLVPLPFGSPDLRGVQGFKPIKDMVPHLPFVLTVFVGTVGLWLALAGAARRRRWAGLAAAGLVLAGIEQVAPQALRAISGGVFRYSEKFLFWFALAASLLAGWGLERARERTWRRSGTLAGVVLLALAAAVGLLRPSFAGAYTSALTGEHRIAAAVFALLEIEGDAWIRALALGGALLALAAVLARRFALGVVGCQVLCLWQLAPLWMTDSVTAYGRDAGWWPRLEPGSAVVIADAVSPPWEPTAAYPDERSEAALSRLQARRLAPSPGVLLGTSYPLGTEIEGIYSPLAKFVSRNLGGRGWRERIKWCRALGVDYLVSGEEIRDRAVEAVAVADRGGRRDVLYRVHRPAGRVWWPDSVVAAPGPAQAFVATRGLADLIPTVVASASPPAQGSARVELVEWLADRIVVEVEGDGGLLAVRRSYTPLFEARSGEIELPTAVVNGFLTGVLVPPGRHRVRLEVSAVPEILASGIAIAACLVAGYGALRRRPERLSALKRSRSAQG